MLHLLIINLVIMYIVACADDVGDATHRAHQRVLRVVLWPLTVTSWFRTQNIRLHRMLNILWTVLIAGWFVSLLIDRLP